MIKNFQEVEDILADDLFLAWYFKKDQEQVKAWENWLIDNPQQQPLVREAVTLMNSFYQNEVAVSPAQVESTLSQLNSRLDQKKTPVVTMKSSQRRWWMSAAAAILLLIGGFAFFKLNQPKQDLGTAYGEVCTNRLPDGSTMILNANSKAELSEGWEDGKDREVWLNGEAFFKVAKTPQRSRFIVHTDNLDIIVTGTQFNVLNRDNKTTVLLSEGSVIIRTKDGKELAMKPGDYVEMENQLIARKTAKEEDVLAWKDNRLSFDSIPLTEAARKISSHYGVKIVFADDSAGRAMVTGIMPNNNLDDLLKSIEIVTDVRITKTETEIIISSHK